MYYLTEEGRKFKEIVPKSEVANQSPRAVALRQAYKGKAADARRQYREMDAAARPISLQRKKDFYKTLFNTANREQGN